MNKLVLLFIWHDHHHISFIIQIIQTDCAEFFCILRNLREYQLQIPFGL